MLDKNVRAGRVAAWLAAIGLVAGVVAACVELQGQLGSDCLKGSDCQSGVCSALRCASPPPLFDAGFGPDAGDASVDGPAGPEGDDSGMIGPDATGLSDAPPVGDARGPDGQIAPDAPTDAIQAEAAPDASVDAPIDAPADARADAVTD